MNAVLPVDDSANHVINATDTTNIGFSVSGRDAATTETATFTDLANHRTMVNIGGNGNNSADLTNPTDGTISSSLLATDPAGNAATATGNTVSLDTNGASTPNLSVNAAKILPDVIVTVSGLQSDYSGAGYLYKLSRSPGRGAN